MIFDIVESRIANFIRDTFPGTCYNFSSIDRILPKGMVSSERQMCANRTMARLKEMERDYTIDV